MSTLPFEPADREPVRHAYGHGGVPWFLLLFYLAFLVFATWYALENVLPDFLDQGPGQQPQSRSIEAPR